MNLFISILLISYFLLPVCNFISFYIILVTSLNKYLSSIFTITPLLSTIIIFLSIFLLIYVNKKDITILKGNILCAVSSAKFLIDLCVICVSLILLTLYPDTPQTHINYVILDLTLCTLLVLLDLPLILVSLYTKKIHIRNFYISDDEDYIII
jgi:hypothetical protein